MKVALVFLIPAVVVAGGILLLRLWIGTTAAVLVVGLGGMGLQVYGLVSLRRKASVTTADVTIETLDPVRLEEFRRAFLLSRPPRGRRLLTLGMAVALAMCFLVAWLASGAMEQIVGSLILPLMIGLAFAGLVEDKKDREFMEKDPELHKRYSRWRGKGPFSPEVILYRRASARHWLTGGEPEWTEP